MNGEVIEHRPSQTVPEVRLITADEFKNEFIERTRTVTNRLIMQAMSVTYDEVTGPMFDAVCEASEERGVKVRALADAYSYLFDDDIITFDPRFAMQSLANVKKLKDTLAKIDEKGEAGFVGSYVNSKGLWRFHPWAQRNHTKFYVFDDTVITGGGMNFTQKAFAKHDFMMVFQNVDFADWCDQYTALQYANPDMDLTDDSALQLDEYTYHYLDAGVPNQSAIYDLVCNVANQPDIVSINMATQMYPTRKLDKILEARQVSESCSVRLVVNCPEVFASPTRWSEKLAAMHSRLDVQCPNDGGFLHAKAVVFTWEDGRKLAVSGSHNFHERGVKYGTVENAIVSTDPFIVSQIESFLENIPVAKG